MSLLTFNHDQEPRQKTPPMLRLDLVARAIAVEGQVMSLIHDAASVKSEKQTRAEEKYGKFAALEIFGTKWDGFRAHKAAEATTDPLVTSKIEKPVAAAPETHAESTILDDELFVDQHLFKTMQNDHTSDVAEPQVLELSEADKREAKRQALIIENRQRAHDAAVTTGESNAFIKASTV
ncbi:hypothetical protein BH10PAT3_BH10PAT3_2540 [soil metagenome]